MNDPNPWAELFARATGTTPPPTAQQQRDELRWILGEAPPSPALSEEGVDVRKVFRRLVSD